MKLKKGKFKYVDFLNPVGRSHRIIEVNGYSFEHKGICFFVAKKGGRRWRVYVSGLGLWLDYWIEDKGYDLTRRGALDMFAKKMDDEGYFKRVERAIKERGSEFKKAWIKLPVNEIETEAK